MTLKSFRNALKRAPNPSFQCGKQASSDRSAAEPPETSQRAHGAMSARGRPRDLIRTALSAAALAARQLNLTKTGAPLSMGWLLGFIVWGLALSGNLGYIGGGINLSYGQCARSQGWPRSPYHLLWFGCYRSPGRDGRMKNRFGRLHLGCLQWCLVEECGKLRVSCCRGVKPRQPSRVCTRRAALYVAMLKRCS